MSERSLFDEAARILAMPIPRRKTFKYLTAAFAGALLPSVWPKEAAASDYDPRCSGACLGCNPDRSCYHWGGLSAKLVDDPCTTSTGQAGHCVKAVYCRGYAGGACCRCVPGPPPNARALNDIPDVAITREASLAAGNCREGTDWVASWFPGREFVSAREAAAAAIVRGKPKLARYIARTALVVQRSAQV
jgi:hypothetical protein